jgi:ubiquinone/menaquinone biosynthesis C-methylase UbiE
MTLSRQTYKWFYDTIHCRYYDLAMKYCFLPLGGEKKCRDHLIEHIEFSPGERIMDMCCGTGGATFAIARRAPEDCKIVGMDLSSGQIGVATKRSEFSNVEFVEGDVSQTGFEEECFDKVFITHALHEMQREIRLRVLRESRRILREGGEVIVLELDNPESVFIRLLAAFWFFYWLPFNFETPTRKDMLRHGVVSEMREVGFKNVGKISKYRGVLQVVQGEK